MLTAADTNPAGTGTSRPKLTRSQQLRPRRRRPWRSPARAETTTAAAQTIAGTVDVADADLTVKVLDGTTNRHRDGGRQRAAVIQVTCFKQGANVPTATDTNPAGTGTSGAVTYTLQSTTPAPPTLTIAKSDFVVSRDVAER